MNSLYQLKHDQAENGCFFSFCGPVSQDLMVEFGTVLKLKMKLEDADSGTILKVFSIVIEQTQNIIHYSADKQKSPPGVQPPEELSFGVITVGKRDGRYIIAGGNKIRNEEIEKLDNRLGKIQAMDSKELKAFYREQRRLEPKDGSKGAGLGFIEMARKSSAPIEYFFEKIDREFSFFTLQISISIRK